MESINRLARRKKAPPLPPSPQSANVCLAAPGPRRELLDSNFRIPNWGGGASRPTPATTVDLAPCDCRRTRNTELPSDDKYSVCTVETGCILQGPGMLLPRSTAVLLICAYAHMLICPWHQARRGIATCATCTNTATSGTYLEPRLRGQADWPASFHHFSLSRNYSC